MQDKRYQNFEDDAKEPVRLMVRHRLPWLALGLAGGIIATILASNFEGLLASNIQIAFFIPVIVYMADALGHQSENVFVRNLGRRVKVKFGTYLLKEFFLGILLGGFFGALIGAFAFLWFGELNTAFTVGLAMFITMSIAPLVALIIPEILFKEHTDPAVGSGPFATVIQDLLSLLIYFFIATIIVF